MNKAVVLGCNYYIGLSIARCLGREGVHVVACDYDFDNYAAKTKYINETLMIKDLNKIGESAINGLIEYGKKQSEKPVLLPSHDKYVEFIDTYYDELSKYYLISQAKGGLNSNLMDKLKLYDIAREHHVKLPKTILMDSTNFEKEIEDITFPCIIKPIDTVEFTKLFHEKVIECHNLDEVKKAYQRCNDHNLRVFVQEIIPGFDDHMVTYDFYVDKDGKTTHYMTAQKQRQWPINFGASVFTIQKYNKQLIDIGKPFIEAIGYRGFGEIEFKIHSKTKEIYLIEINARTTNFNNLIYKLGINMPYIAYCDLTGNCHVENKYIETDTNLAFIYGYEDLAAIIGYHKTKQVSAMKSIGKLMKRTLAPAIFSLDDMKPWLSFNFSKLKRLLSK